ncbi:hypothetical protein ACFYYN_35985 [Streptomyces sp. NPDC001902]
MASRRPVPPPGEFGLSGFVDFLVRHHADRLPLGETLCRLMGRLSDRQVGEFQDDALLEHGLNKGRWGGSAGWGAGPAGV